jgi:four helix bundle protein
MRSVSQQRLELREDLLSWNRHEQCTRHAMAKTFREMIAWQLAFELMEQVIALLAQPGPAAKDFRFRDQLASSVRSVPANIAEGYGRFNPAEIARFVDIARGSLDETENHLRAGVASSYFPAETVGPMIKLAARCRTALNGWHTYLRSVKNAPRFRPKRR